MKRLGCFLSRSVSGIYIDQFSASHTVTISTSDEVSRVDGSLETDFVTLLWRGERVMVRSSELQAESELFSPVLAAAGLRTPGLEAAGEEVLPIDEQLRLTELLLELSKACYSPTLKACQGELESRVNQLRHGSGDDGGSHRPILSRSRLAASMKRCHHYPKNNLHGPGDRLQGPSSP